MVLLQDVLVVLRMAEDVSIVAPEVTKADGVAVAAGPIGQRSQRIPAELTYRAPKPVALRAGGIGRSGMLPIIDNFGPRITHHASRITYHVKTS